MRLFVKFSNLMRRKPVRLSYSKTGVSMFGVSLIILVTCDNYLQNWCFMVVTKCVDF